jgi:hypothetical protein
MAGSPSASNLSLTVTGASSLVCVDSWGNTFTLSVAGGQVTFPIAELPQWIRVPNGVTVTPVGIGLMSNLALAATPTVTGQQTKYIPMINDGVVSNQYFWDSSNWDEPSFTVAQVPIPYNDLSGIFPQTVTLDFGGAVTANRIIVYSFPPWQNGATLADFDIDTFDGSMWTTRLNHPRPAGQTFLFTSTGACIYESFWDEQYVFDVSFSSASITKMRVVVRGCSYGDTDHPMLKHNIYNDSLPPFQFLVIPDIQVFNVGAAPGPGPTIIRQAATRAGTW